MRVRMSKIFLRTGDLIQWRFGEESSNGVVLKSVNDVQLLVMLGNGETDIVDRRNCSLIRLGKHGKRT
jgi:hypothetical protein